MLHFYFFCFVVLLAFSFHSSPYLWNKRSEWDVVHPERDETAFQNKIKPFISEGIDRKWIDSGDRVGGER